MKLELYQIDAFTDKIFGGNPAAVCPLPHWIEPALMQEIAAENNLAETAFFVKKSEDVFAIRWFMPHAEIDLCGHATLAAAHVIFAIHQSSSDTIHFDSQSGRLTTWKTSDDLIMMDFPARIAREIEMPAEALAAFDPAPKKAMAHRDLILVFDHEKDIRSVSYNLAPLRDLPYLLTAITAAGESHSDFVSRVFDPFAQLAEDPVTGSTHCSLIPYWAGCLDKTRLLAHQVSARGGTLHCEYHEDRVFIGGQARTYFTGQLYTA